MTTATATCPGEHPAPPYLVDILPPVRSAPELAKALAALRAGCKPCHEAHRQAAMDDPMWAWKASSLLMMYASVALSVQGRSAEVADGEELVATLGAEAMELMLEPARQFLRSIRVDAAATLKGYPAPAWNFEAFYQLAKELTPEHRLIVWNDCLIRLAGTVEGEGRARAEAEQ